MKKTELLPPLLISIILLLLPLTLMGQGTFFLDDNGVTIRCPGASPGETGMVNGVEYEAVNRDMLSDRLKDGEYLFRACTTPITNLESMFMGWGVFDEDISSWDVSNVTDMSQMFLGNYIFNSDIGHWDVSSVTDMRRMFADAWSFNQDISKWDVSNVTDMSGMFLIAEIFNQDISSWDVSSVTDMSQMFQGAYNFDADIGYWDVSNVTDIGRMFEWADSFNQDIGGWDVSSVSDMSSMFGGAISFNQNLSGWCVSNIPSEPGSFSTGSPLLPEFKPIWGTCPAVRWPNYTMSIMASDTHVNTRELVLGTAPDATTNYDEQYDVLAPPPPPADGFDARIRFDGSDYFTFYQPPTTEQTQWTLLFAPRSGYGPITLEWNPDAIEFIGGVFLLCDPFGGNMIHVNMRQQSSVTIEQEFITGLKLVHTLPVEVPQQYVSGWNLVSLPLEHEHHSFKDLFSDALDNTLYSYSGTYLNEQVLQHGQGYWLNMAEASSVTFTGLGLEDVTVELMDGWNLIGGVSEASVIDDQGNIVLAGTLYGYDGTYYSAGHMEPGLGYWVATRQQGSVTVTAQPEGSSKEILQSPLASPEDLQRNGFHRIALRSGDHAELSLYFGGQLASEYHPMQLILPPVPPQGSFDARLAENQWISEADAVSVALQPGSDPLSMVIHGEGRYNIQLWSGSVDRGHQTVNSGEQMMLDGDLSKLTLSISDISGPELPMEFTLEQNYPNPFNPGTEIRYGITKRSHVQLAVYDITGRRVATVVNEPREAGYHSLNFDAAGLASGVYIYRIRAGEFSQSRVMVLTK